MISNQPRIIEFDHLVLRDRSIDVIVTHMMRIAEKNIGYFVEAVFNGVPIVVAAGDDQIAVVDEYHHQRRGGGA